jgi:hypothetical protein
MMRVRWSLLGAAAVFAACQPIAPEPIALRGPVPRTIAVWPFPLARADADAGLVFTGLANAVAARGYATTPPPVTAQLLADKGLDASTDLATAGGALVTDAVLQLVVREFGASGARPLREAEWELEWRLLAVPGGAVVWSFAHRGTWHAPRNTFDDPHRALDAEPDVVPIGGPARGGYRDAAELVAALHGMAMAKLPRRTR